MRSAVPATLYFGRLRSGLQTGRHGTRDLRTAPMQSQGVDRFRRSGKLHVV